MGVIPFVDKFRARRAIKSADNEIERLKDRIDRTRNKIDAAKRRADKTDSVKVVNNASELDIKLQSLLCPGGSGGGDSGADAEAARRCRTQLKLKKGGRVPNEKKAEWDACIERETGG